MKSYKMYEQSAEDDVVDWDKQEFYNIPNASHNGETQCT